MNFLCLTIYPKYLKDIFSIQFNVPNCLNDNLKKIVRQNKTNFFGCTIYPKYLIDI